jgi:peptidoglycan hydrolase CwlO-like protein
MKDFKMISIYVLTTLFLFSLFLNIRSCTKIDDTKYDKLHQDNINLQKIRDSLVKANSKLKSEYKTIQDRIDEREKTIDKLKNDLDISKEKVKQATDKANRLAKEKLEADRKIDELLKNPIRRNDDDLIESLKNKLKP